eukprot:CAMPEP_0184494340 /NCGR_PEP_ID=MMETSP0113_2-20130426/28482_1 /TAXON_ID=91329 /ORGANISM="Norrisiella sphaerica, Strain BC52" /LENGTH=48 /DNA_ID= /DNA_START= /DNA_END= /DNA_ORIENTATION=
MIPQTLGYGKIVQAEVKVWSVGLSSDLLIFELLQEGNGRAISSIRGVF